MSTFDYIKAVRDRLILLLERHEPTMALLKAGNRSRRGDTSRHGLGHKPAAGQPADFPQLDLEVGDGEEGTQFETFAHEEGAEDAGYERDVTQDYRAVIVFEDTNPDRRSEFELEVRNAWEAGRTKLADPDTADSELAYVVGWGRLQYERTIEDNVKGSRRAVTRITIPVRMQFLESDLNT